MLTKIKLNESKLNFEPVFEPVSTHFNNMATPGYFTTLELSEIKGTQQTCPEQRENREIDAMWSAAASGQIKDTRRVGKTWL